MHIRDPELELAVPLLVSAQLELRSPVLAELLDRMRTAARRRGLADLVALLELQAAQSEGPSREGPSAVPE